jgi:hypothetical protein
VLQQQDENIHGVSLEPDLQPILEQFAGSEVQLKGSKANAAL